MREVVARPEAQVLLVVVVVLVFEWHHRDSWGLVPHRYWTFGWFATSVACFFLVPVLFAALHPRLKVADTGLGLGDVRWWGKWTVLLYAVMVPVLMAAASRQEFRDFYPIWSGARDGGLPLLAYEASYAAYFFAWEYLYRGFLLQPLARISGPIAIVMQAVPFALTHFTKPEPEVWGAIVAALVLGTLAWRARSFWPAFLLHAACAITFDLLCVYLP